MKFSRYNDQSLHELVQAIKKLLADDDVLGIELPELGGSSGEELVKDDSRNLKSLISRNSRYYMPPDTDDDIARRTSHRLTVFGKDKYLGKDQYLVDDDSFDIDNDEDISRILEAYWPRGDGTTDVIVRQSFKPGIIDAIKGKY